MKITSDVYSYELDWKYDEPLGVQVVETEGRSMLFGAGTEKTVDQLTTIAHDHEVDSVVIEHADSDHYEGAEELRKQLGVEIIAPELDVPILTDHGIDPDQTIQDGESFRGVVAIHIPGHTPGNMSFIYNDVLIAGDSVIGSNSIFSASDEWSGLLSIINGDYSHDDQQARENVSRLLNYDYEVVLVSHGDNVVNEGKQEVETLVHDLSM